LQDRFFTDEAEGYERDVVRSPFYQALDDLTVHRWGATLPANSIVLDIGAGTGRVALRLAERGHHVIALDLTEALLRQTQQKAAEAGLTIDRVIADAENLPVVDGALDAVVAHGVLHHMTAPAAVIGHAGRALREGGRWFSLDPHRSPFRGVFDAAMRLVPLWKEEAAPDALQTEERLLSWCRDSGISASASFSCYVLPHLVTPFPRAIARVVLQATDALFERSVLRNAAGVIHVSGVKGSTPPDPRRHGARTLLFRALAMIVVLVFARVWQIDPDVALNSTAYYMGGLEQTIAIANAPHQWGVLMVDAGSEPLERGPDDIGYAVSLQMLSAVAGPITGAQVAHLHQILYAALAFLLAWALGWRFRSTTVSIVVLVLLLVLGNRLAMLLYGQVSNQTITSLFPVLFLSAFVWWSARLDDARRRAWMATACLGVLTGVIDLTRHSHGLAVLLTVATILAFGVRGLRRRAQLGLAFAIGFVLVTIAVPATMKVHRDVRLNRFAGWRFSYLRKPPQHHVYYTLLTAVGRYPNSLGLAYEDRVVDRYIASHAPPGMGSIAAAGPLWVQYVGEHPGEYARALVAGVAELPAFVAYTTFMAARRWSFAWPDIRSDVDVDQADVARYGERLLMNVRYRYLRLAWWQWMIFVGAWFAMLSSAFVALRQRSASRHERLLVGGSLIYLAWVALPRALVPVQGMDLVFAFWCVSLLCAAALWRAYPPPITPGDLRVDP
jgi:SAM-dependent methyltransferase